ncbi:hypothetical protein L2E82_40454 [Cichorium intybus]|uniref:Uncharacterized protein n=1 Tax=Cichorium intybus TaxID=13427 RepID=A0ACB9AQF0_CICIN|nr:hypothetical protein L2E82_40454 [Cichorium intybus]
MKGIFPLHYRHFWSGTGRNKKLLVVLDTTTSYLSTVSLSVLGATCFNDSPEFHCVTIPDIVVIRAIIIHFGVVGEDDYAQETLKIIFTNNISFLLKSSWDGSSCSHNITDYKNAIMLSSKVAVDSGNFCLALEAIEKVLSLSKYKRIDVELLERVMVEIERVELERSRENEMIAEILKGIVVKCGGDGSNCQWVVAEEPEKIDLTYRDVSVNILDTELLTT